MTYPIIQFFIHGQWRAGPDWSATTQAVINPSDESILGELPVANDAAIAAAVESAQHGLHAWSAYSPSRRQSILFEAARLIRERTPQIAALASMELGTPPVDATGYVNRAADFIEWDAAEGRRLYGQVVPSDPDLQQLVIHEPIGVVAAFTPWNAPVMIPCRKIASALSAGCAIILKAAEETPACAMAVVQAFADAGVPSGALNLLFGDPANVSHTLISHPVVRLVTFTGSVPVGKQLAQLAGAQMKPVIMELGGHAPVIVFDDADIEDAAQRCVISKFRNTGQACLAPTRFYIHESRYDDFVSEFVARMNKLQVGAPQQSGSQMGPLVHGRRLTAVADLVEDAKSKGADVLGGGERIARNGFFYAPTALANLDADARILREEPFGPVACLARYSDIDQVIDAANALPYGLAAYAFTRDISRQHELARRIQCGSLAINHTVVSAAGIPFGGVKDSGYGREGGAEGVRGYTIQKTVTSRIPALKPTALS